MGTLGTVGQAGRGHHSGLGVLIQVVASVPLPQISLQQTSPRLSHSRPVSPVLT